MKEYYNYEDLANAMFKGFSFKHTLIDAVGIFIYLYYDNTDLSLVGLLAETATTMLIFLMLVFIIVPLFSKFVVYKVECGSVMAKNFYDRFMQERK